MTTELKKMTHIFNHHSVFQPFFWYGMFQPCFSAPKNPWSPSPSLAIITLVYENSTQLNPNSRASVVSVHSLPSPPHSDSEEAHPTGQEISWVFEALRWSMVDAIFCGRNRCFLVWKFGISLKKKHVSVFVNYLLTYFGLWSCLIVFFHCHQQQLEVVECLIAFPSPGKMLTGCPCGVVTPSLVIFHLYIVSRASFAPNETWKHHLGREIVVNLYIYIYILIYTYWMVVSKVFYFHPNLGKWSNLTNIFQMGRNHQLVYLCIKMAFQPSYIKSRPYQKRGPFKQPRPFTGPSWIFLVASKASWWDQQKVP